MPCKHLHKLIIRVRDTPQLSMTSMLEVLTLYGFIPQYCRPVLQEKPLIYVLCTYLSALVAGFVSVAGRKSTATLFFAFMALTETFNMMFVSSRYLSRVSLCSQINSKAW